MMLYLRLFFEFFKAGLFAVGGGMATIPFLYNIADTTGWFSRTDLANMIAIGESTPGPIGVNMATYVGYLTGMNQGGTLSAIIGSVVATLGLITPSVIIILLVSMVLSNFRNNRFVNSAFYTLRPASTGLIAAAGLSVIVSNLFFAEQGFTLSCINWKGWILAVAIWLMTNKIKYTKSWHPIIFIGISALIGIVWAM